MCEEDGYLSIILETDEIGSCHGWSDTGQVAIHGCDETTEERHKTQEVNQVGHLQLMKSRLAGA